MGKERIMGDMEMIQKELNENSKTENIKYEIKIIHSRELKANRMLQRRLMNLKIS